jgi:fructose-1-phosphate kinase PfkB-like protein
MLGVPNIATGFAGRRELEDYDRSFAGGHVQAQFLAVDGTTRENITVNDPKSRVETHIRDTGVTPTSADLDRMRNKVNLLARADTLVVLSGSLPPNVDVSFAVELVGLAGTSGAQVAVDGPGDLLRDLGSRELWLLEPNTQEFASMHEVDTLADDELIPLGCEVSGRVRTLIITCGSAGGHLFVNGMAFMGQVDIDPAEVRSAVGCGDAMLGAYIAAQHRGDDIKTSYRYAPAVATAAATHEMPGHFDLEAVGELLSRSSIEVVEAC